MHTHLSNPHIIIVDRVRSKRLRPLVQTLISWLMQLYSLNIILISITMSEELHARCMEIHALLLPSSATSRTDSERCKCVLEIRNGEIHLTKCILIPGVNRALELMHCCHGSLWKCCCFILNSIRGDKKWREGATLRNEWFTHNPLSIISKVTPSTLHNVKWKKKGVWK